MKGFMLGLAIGALGVYAALRLSDEETREELYDTANRVKSKACEEIEHGLVVGKGKAMRAGVIARQEIRKGKQKINEITGDVAGKLSDEFADIEAKARANS